MIESECGDYVMLKMLSVRCEMLCWAAVSVAGAGATCDCWLGLEMFTIQWSVPDKMAAEHLAPTTHN